MKIEKNTGSTVINNIFGIFGVAVLIIGVLNLLLIHPVPGLVYLLLSLIFFPPINSFFTREVGFSVSILVKIFLAIVITLFTLGVSDLGDMLDDL